MIINIILNLLYNNFNIIIIYIFKIRNKLINKNFSIILLIKVIFYIFYIKKLISNEINYNYY